MDGDRIVLWAGEETAPMPCPNCGAGPLVPKGTLAELNGGASGRYEMNFGAEVPATRAVMFNCPDRRGYCDPVVVVAEAYLGGDPFPNTDEEMGSMRIALRVRYIEPAISLLGPIGPHVDRSLVELGRSAGLVVWVDPGAAVNKLRLACEDFLTILGLPKRKPGGGFFTLRGRIQMADDEGLLRPQVRELIDGLRWLGNSGSHSGESHLSASEVIKGGRVLSLALRLQFPDPEDDTTRQKALDWIASKGGTGR